MGHEIETKVLDIHAYDVKACLAELGALKVRETRLSVDWFRPKGVRHGEDPWYLRIRSNSEGKHEVTWKGKPEILGVARKHKEINFATEHPSELTDLFEEIGLEKYAHQEKDRTSYRLKSWLIEIDSYPGMPAFLEIEGTSEEHIREAITLLRLDTNRTWADGERTLIEKVYGLDWNTMKF